jgi:hypothetical protein
VVLAVVAIWLVGGPPQAAGQVITGTGTPGNVPKWTGSTTQGNSIIAESAGLIGIGTSTPTVKLDVNGRLKTKGTIDTGAHYKIRGTQVLGVDAVLGNTASGVNALLSNTTGSHNTASGHDALLSNTTGSGNTATGLGALRSNTTGSGNTATGFEALRDNTSSSDNTASGVGALRNNTTGSDNTAIGDDALEDNTGDGNDGIGADTMRHNATGGNNTAVGDVALPVNTTGSANTAIGFGALLSNTSGTDNTAVGKEALQSNTSGSSNIALGNRAGSVLTTGNFNIDIGHTGVAGESATIRMGSSSQTRTFIAGISGLGVPGGVGLLVNSSGQLGSVLSSRRVKDEIRDMDEASEKLSRLRLVTFRYTQALADGSHPLQYGLIAEEVAEVYPELVVDDPQTGEPQTVLYHVLPALLLNELQRQQRQLETQTTQMEAQAAELTALRARLTILE